MADAVESPLPGDRHGGFGERPGETDWEQPRHRAPGRLDQSAGQRAVASSVGHSPVPGLALKVVTRTIQAN